MTHRGFTVAPLFLIVIGLAACSRPLERYEFARPQMGTLFRLVFYAESDQAANAASAAAFDRIDALNATLSDYDPASELSRLSATAGSGRAVRVSDDLWTMLEMSQRIAAQTDGAFDITVGPVIRLWRRARRQERLPDSQALAEAMRALGREKIVVDPRRRTATLTAPGMKLDLGGIAKGYAADEALKVLRGRGIRRALVAAGGDVVVGDPPPGSDGWTVAVKSMVAGEEVDRYVLLRDAAVSTSGDAFQFVEIDGQRYSHIVDPRTGIGLTTPMGVTVIARHGALSDAYATAVSVLGPQRGLELIESFAPVGVHAAVIVYLTPEGRRETLESSGVRHLRFVQPDAGTRTPPTPPGQSPGS